MNDFHILSIYIQNKDVAGAMCVLRDKSEFPLRKILEKLKVRVTTQTGRAFTPFSGVIMVDQPQPVLPSLTLCFLN